MMRLGFLLLACGMTGSLVWATTTARPSCESQAQRTSVDFYMGLIKQGLATQEVTLQDLEWLSRQRSPSEPQWAGKSYKNLALRNGFERVVSQFQTGDWAQARGLLEQELARVTGRQQQIIAGAEATRFFFGAVPLKYKVPQGNFLLQFFVSRSGDIFTSSNDQSECWVHEVKSGKSIRLENFIGNAAWTDFYETATGQVLFAYMFYGSDSPSRSQLRVIDARTGDELFKHDFPYEDDPPYQPFLFERDGRVKVTLGYFRKPIADTAGNVPIYTVDVQSGEVSNHKIMSGPTLRFHRLESGEIYGFGISKFNIFLYDVLAGHYTLNIHSEKLTNINHFPKLMGEESPTVAIYDSTLHNMSWHMANPRSGKIEEIPLVRRSKDASLLTFADKSLWFLDYTKAVDSDVVELELKPIDPQLQSQSVKRVLKNFNLVQSVGLVNLRGKDLIFVVEDHGLSTAIYFLDRRLKVVGIIDFGQKLEQGSTIFANNADGRIYLFARQSGSQRRVLYQVFGPEQASGLRRPP